MYKQGAFGCARCNTVDESYLQVPVLWLVLSLRPSWKLKWVLPGFVSFELGKNYFHFHRNGKRYSFFQLFYRVPIHPRWLAGFFHQYAISGRLTSRSNILEQKDGAGG